MSPPASVLPARAAALVRELGLAAHPEGGFFREIFRSPSTVVAGERGCRSTMTTIYFLLASGQSSRWHALRSDEIWHLYEGGPLELSLADPAIDRLKRVELGRAAGVRSPVHVVPAGWWQAARPLGDYALLGCTVGPGFEFADFRFLADDARAAARLRERAPEAARWL